MKNATLYIFLIALLGIFPSCNTPPEKGSGLSERVVEVRLDNGMRWLLVKRGYAPLFAGIVKIKAGGTDEKEGEAGLAHLLEHMSFKGTTTIGTTDYKREKIINEKIDELMKKGGGKIDEIEKLRNERDKITNSNEIWEIFKRNGAVNLNAYTSKDVTAYHAEMPSSKLELWIYLVSEMLRDPSFREFYTEKDVVLEELRSSLDNDPIGLIYSNLLNKAFERSSYSWMTIGNKEDIRGLTRDEIISFYDKYYTPECMVGAIVGEFDVEKTKEYLNKYFGRLKGKSPVCRRTLQLDPPQKKMKEYSVRFDAGPRLLMGFHKLNLIHFDDYIFDVFSYLFCEGDSSILQKKLVMEKRLAKRIACMNSYPGTRLPNLFIIYAEPFNKKSLNDLRDAIWNELNLLKNSLVDKKELNRIKNQMHMTFLSQLDTNFDLAHMLSYFEVISGSWKYILNHADEIEKISAEDLQQAARTYFKKENAIDIELYKGK